MKSKKLLYSFVFLSGFIFSNLLSEETNLLSVNDAFIFNTEIKENRIIASWEIKPGYYLYKKSILIQDGNKLLKHRFITKNELRVFDEFFGETLILKDFLKVDAELLSNDKSLFSNIKIGYQGCAEGKYCYPKIIKSL